MYCSEGILSILCVYCRSRPWCVRDPGAAPVARPTTRRHSEPLPQPRLKTLFYYHKITILGQPHNENRWTQCLNCVHSQPPVVFEIARAAPVAGPTASRHGKPLHNHA
jgi:hypothetical protein